MHKQLSLKHGRTLAILVLAALAVIASASQAFAQGQFNESDSYTLKKVAPNNNLWANNSVAETRDPQGNILDVWRANDLTNRVWLSYNNGEPFQIGTTATLASPAVAAWGASGFIVLQTGTDSKIYYTFVYGPNSNQGGWTPIPGQTTPKTMSVSAAPVGTGSEYIYVVYRGSGNDTRVYGTFIDPQGNWSSPTNFAGGLAVAPPAVCLNSATNTLYVLAVGLDNQIWLTHQQLGQPDWNSWAGLGAYTGTYTLNDQPPSAPSCAGLDTGNTVLDYVDTTGHPHYGVFTTDGQPVGWTRDITNWQTVDAVTLTSVGGTAWAVFTGFALECTGSAEACNNNNDDLIWWKVVTTE